MNRGKGEDMDTTRFCAKSLLLASVLTLPACMTIPKGLGDYDARFKELGVASWYGGSFHGRLTANGEIYDQFKMTAAHRLLPLGSVARVTNPENGRAVEVLINDRGPFIRGRIIDLSYAAAEHLGAVYPGTLPVVVDVLQMGNEARRPAACSGRGRRKALASSCAWPRSYGGASLLVRHPGFAWWAANLRWAAGATWTSSETRGVPAGDPTPR